MKTLYLTSRQAKRLAYDLNEYADLTDTHNREIFEGFKLNFGDLFSEEIQPEDSFELIPLPNYTEIAGDQP